MNVLKQVSADADSELKWHEKVFTKAKKSEQKNKIK